MREDLLSRTAWRVALSRPAHQLLDEPKILQDPLALRIVGPETPERIGVERQRYHSLMETYLRAFVVARSRTTEAALAEAVARGVDQYMVLGAGLDTFAYRNPYPAAALEVVEVDHPVTQAWEQRQWHHVRCRL